VAKKVALIGSHWRFLKQCVNLLDQHTGMISEKKR